MGDIFPNPNDTLLILERKVVVEDARSSQTVTSNPKDLREDLDLDLRRPLDHGGLPLDRVRHPVVGHDRAVRQMPVAAVAVHLGRGRQVRLVRGREALPARGHRRE